MRILFVTTSTTLGGAEKTVYCLATLLDPKHFQVASIVSLKPFGAYAQKLSALGLPTATLGLRGKPSLKHVRELARLIDQQKPDIVHAVMYQAIQLCRLAKTRSAHPFKLVSSPRVGYRTRSLGTLFIDRMLKNRDDLDRRMRDSRQYQEVGCAEKVKMIYPALTWAGCFEAPTDSKRLELRLGGRNSIGAAGR